MKQVILIERSELAELQQGHTLNLRMADGQPVLIALERPSKSSSGNGTNGANGTPHRRRRRKDRKKLQAAALEVLAKAKRPVRLKDLKASLGLANSSRSDKNALEKVMVRLANNKLVRRMAPGTYKLKKG